MRLDPIPPNDLTKDQRALYEDMRAGIEKSFRGFATERPDGALIGPWNPWLHMPEIGKPVWQLTKAMGAASVVPDRCRQIAILATGAHFRAGYEIYAHVAVAQLDGLPDHLIATIIAGERPAELSREEALAYDLAASLCAGGVLPELTWQLAKDAFGEKGVAELVYLVGLYCMVSVTLNGFNIPVPDRTEN